MLDQSWADFSLRLPEILSSPLPGFEAQKTLAPRVVDGPYLRDGRVDQKNAVPAAALILLFPVGDVPHFFLTVRNPNLPSHSGQTSLPGGLQENAETLAETAVRETHEELGVSPSLVTVAGALTPIYIPPSNFLLHPFAGICEERPELTPSKAEVSRVMEISVMDLGAPDTLVSETRELKGRVCDVPYFDLDGEKVWGATAMVLAEFLCVLEGRSRTS